MTKVTGSATGETPVANVIEPADTAIAAMGSSGQTINADTGWFSTIGSNVSQTIAVTGTDSPVNCSVSSVVAENKQTGETGASITVAPGQQFKFKLVIVIDDIPVTDPATVIAWDSGAIEYTAAVV